jgi:hypothetical protein
MTHLVRNAPALTAIVWISIALSCAQPLSDPPAPTNGSNSGVDRTDTITVRDTLIIVDTIVVNDTITIADTIVVNDTITIADTVIVPLPDSGDSNKVCAQLGASQKELVWLFVNEPGEYKLEFRALTENLKPAQVLVVNIDGETFEWKPSENTELTLERNLVNRATVRISPKNPSAFGHAIDICLWVTKL